MSRNRAERGGPKIGAIYNSSVLRSIDFISERHRLNCSASIEGLLNVKMRCDI